MSVSQFDAFIRNAIATLAAPIHGKDRDDLVSEDLRQQTRLRRIAALTVLTISLLLVVALILLRVSRQNEQIALSRMIATTARQQAAVRLDRSLLLNAAAYRMNPGPVTLDSLLASLEQVPPQLVTYLWGHADTVTDLAFSPDGHTLASCGSDGSIIVWDPEATPPAKIASMVDVDPSPYVDGTTEVNALAFSVDGSVVGSGTAAGGVTLWDTRTGEPLVGPVQAYAGGSESIAIYKIGFSSDGRTLLAAAAFSMHLSGLAKWDNPGLRSFRVSACPGCARDATNRAFGPAGRLVATSFVRGGDPGSSESRGLVVVWDSELPSTDFTYQPERLADGPLFKLPTDVGLVTSAAFGPRGRFLASGTSEGSLLLWNLVADPARTAVELVRGRRDPSQRAGEGLEGDRAFGEPAQSGICDERGAESCASSADGNWLAERSESEPGNITISRVATREVVHEIAIRMGGVNSWAGDQILGLDMPRLVFSADGRFLATSTLNGEVWLWEIDRGELLHGPLVAHDGPVLDVAFSPDGQILASAGTERIHLWHVPSRRRLGEAGFLLPGEVHLEQPWPELSFSSTEGTKLQVVVPESGVGVWDVDAESWVRRACGLANRDLSKEDWNEQAWGRFGKHRDVCR